MTNALDDSRPLGVVVVLECLTNARLIDQTTLALLFHLVWFQVVGLYFEEASQELVLNRWRQEESPRVIPVLQEKTAFNAPARDSPDLFAFDPLKRGPSPCPLR